MGEFFFTFRHGHIFMGFSMSQGIQRLGQRFVIQTSWNSRSVSPRATIAGSAGTGLELQLTFDMFRETHEIDMGHKYFMTTKQVSDKDTNVAELR